MTEKEIQTEILLTFGSLSCIRIWRSAVGVGTPQHSSRPIQFGLAGQCDISGIISPSGRRLEIEVKAENGRLAERQKLFGAMIERMGGVWIVAKSVQDVYRELELHGIQLALTDLTHKKG